MDPVRLQFSSVSAVWTRFNMRVGLKWAYLQISDVRITKYKYN